MRRSQVGFSMIGFMFTFGVLMFGFTAFLKVGPAYYEHYVIEQVTKRLATDYRTQTTSLKDIKETFDKEAAISDIKSVSSRDLVITPEASGHYAIYTSYKRVIELNKNLSLIASFEVDTKKLKSS